MTAYSAVSLAKCGVFSAARGICPPTVGGCVNPGGRWFKSNRGSQKQKHRNRGAFVFAFLSWSCRQRRGPLAVACRIASARYTRLALLALWAPPLAKTILNRFCFANPPSKARNRGKVAPRPCKRATLACRSVQVQQGEPKERNPKLLPIGDGFGFLLFFGDLS